MKKLLGLLTLGLMSAWTASADVIAGWTYENQFLSVNVTNSTVTGLVPAIGSGIASGFHASNATVYSSPVGNGSSKSFSANTWSQGDYYQYQLSTIGYTNISVTWDQTRSSTGPSNFDFAWSTNGTDFTIALDNYTVLSTSWSGSVVSLLTNSYSVDLTLTPAVNNASAVYFRLICDQTGLAVAGTSRNDNFAVNGVATVPEPGVFSLACLALLGLFGWRQFRRIS
jgi:hypothetical protein